MMEMACIGLLLVFYVSRVSTNIIFSSERTHSEVFLGEHFDDVTLPTDGGEMFFMPTMLIMYTRTCADSLVKHQVSLVEVPPLPHMMVLAYDWETYPKHIWFDEKPGTNLKARFPVSKCPTVLFFAKGAEYNTTTSSWTLDSGDNFREWAWDLLKYNLKLINKLGFDVDIFVLENYEKGHQDLLLKDQEETVITVYPSLHLYVYKTSELGSPRDLVAFYVLNGTKELVLLDGDNETQPIRGLRQEKARTVYLQKLINYYVRNWSRNIKQPRFLPKFTKTGYKVCDIPKQLYKTLSSFYKENRDKGVKEPWSDFAHVINQQRIPCTMVWVSGEVRAAIVPDMQKVLEDWCKCSLNLTSIYGIRVYHKGHRLGMHVDMIKTHVVSAILRVAQDEDDDGWPLDVIELDGRRASLTLKPGKMVVYESATLVHGRPSIFTGRGFANIFVHFAPGGGWGYYEDSVNMIGPSSKVPHFPLSEPEWFWNQQPVKCKDEL